MSSSFKKARKIKLPITAAFHASHLRVPNLEKIIGPVLSSGEFHIRRNVVMISTSSGKPIIAETIGETLKLIILDILQEPMHWSRVIEHIVSSLENQSCAIMSVGHVRAADGLGQRMNTAGIKVLEKTELQPLRGSSVNETSNDIAIVGFAARLPESETLEEAWKILENGRDLHKRVSFFVL